MEDTPTVMAVLTGKTVEQIFAVGGTQSWKLNPERASICDYILLCRHKFSSVAQIGGAPCVEHKAAFMIGKVGGIVQSTEADDRHLILMSEYAEVDIPDFWQFARNPVKYLEPHDVAKIPFDELEFLPMPPVDIIHEPLIEQKSSEPLTIGQAKRALALSLGVSEDQIRISIEA